MNSNLKFELMLNLFKVHIVYYAKYCKENYISSIVNTEYLAALSFETYLILEFENVSF